MKEKEKTFSKVKNQKKVKEHVTKKPALKDCQRKIFQTERK